jgi:hypothetical protein
MPFSVDLIRKLESVDPQLRGVLLAFLEEVERSREESVTKKEFLEFAKRTEENFNRVWQSINALTEAQKRTEERLNEFERRIEENFNRVWQAINELTEAQKRTEEEVRKLALGLRRVRKEVGGLSRSVAYALENEAFRHLPGFLKEKHGLEVLDRIIRVEVEGEEINIFGRVRKDGQEACLVGEVVLRLDDRAKLKQVWKKVEAVREGHGGEVVPILVTHFATKGLLELAKKAGIVVVQSFEW